MTHVFKMGDFTNIRAHLRKKLFNMVSRCVQFSPDAFYICHLYILMVLSLSRLSRVSVYERLRTRLIWRGVYVDFASLLPQENANMGGGATHWSIALYDNRGII